MSNAYATRPLPPIAHMSFSGDFGGREKVAVTLQKGMGAAGFECFLYMIVEERLGPERNANLMNSLGENDGRWRMFRTDRRFSWTLLQALKASLVADGVGVVHCHCYKSLFYALLMRAMGMIDAAVFYTLHGLVLRPGLGSALIQTTQNVGLRLCDGVIGCSREILDSSLPPKWKGRSTSIINAVESPLDSYAKVIESKRLARKELAERYGLDESLPIVINVGRLCPQKNFTLYLQMIEALGKGGGAAPVANFLLIGNGALEDDLKAEARLRGIEDRVVFTGFVSDMRQAFLGADVLVQTSIWEGTPMCLLEAQSYGLPSVVPAVGGNTDVVADGVNGTLYPVNDLKTLLTGLRGYLDDPLSGQRCGKKAFEAVRRDFAIETWVERHAAFYREVLAAGKGGL